MNILCNLTIVVLSSYNKLENINGSFNLIIITLNSYNKKTWHIYLIVNLTAEWPAVIDIKR
jgi:hypothetical protein